MFDECMLGVRAQCFHDKWAEKKRLPQGTIRSVNYKWSQCKRSCQCACRPQWEVTPSVVPNALQASVCDEQLMSIGGEIALSGNNICIFTYNTFVIMSRHGRLNIRNGIVWLQTGRSTSTCTATLCLIELWTHQKFESLKNNFRSDEIRIRLC